MVHRPRKPEPAAAMALLIGQVRAAMPFDDPAAKVCGDQCEGCPRKLLEWLDTELTHWEARLAAGEPPRLGDIDRLARSSRKVYAVLARNGLVPPPSA
jgi:hypothetical protein